ncbi:MAG: GNAT family N-acetyltransferase [Alphaproteobacteria bacterium]|nr:GNAT family N-acetyltransferase [Alphaproteobacteria bacterium]
MDNIAIRLLTPEDVAIFQALRLRGCREEPHAFLEDVDDLAQKPTEHFLRHFKNGWIAGAFMDGELVGSSGLYIHQGKKLQHKGTVWGVYVIPEARGHGLAKKLIEIVVEEAKKAGLELVTISTNIQNPITVGIYQKLGFIPCGIEMHILKLADGSYIDDVQMIRFLK